MTERLVKGFIAFVVLLVFVGLAALVLRAPARAQGWPNSEFAVQPIKNKVHRRSYKDRTGRRRETRKVAIIRPQPQPEHEGRQCLSPITVSGDQSITREGAKREAIKSWRSTVRWRHGERFMDFDSVAKRATFQCSQSSIGNTATNVTNTNLDRCELIATPCAAPRLGEGRP